MAAVIAVGHSVANKETEERELGQDGTLQSAMKKKSFFNVLETYYGGRLFRREDPTKTLCLTAKRVGRIRRVLARGAQTKHSGRLP